MPNQGVICLSFLLSLVRFLPLLNFPRTQAGFAASMFDDLHDIACKLGLSAATKFPMDNRKADNIIELFERLPADRVHLIVVRLQVCAQYAQLSEVTRVAPPPTGSRQGHCGYRPQPSG